MKPPERPFTAEQFARLPTSVRKYIEGQEANVAHMAASLAEFNAIAPSASSLEDNVITTATHGKVIFPSLRYARFKTEGIGIAIKAENGAVSILLHSEYGGDIIQECHSGNDLHFTTADAKAIKVNHTNAYNRIVAALMEANPRLPGERDGPGYDTRIRALAAGVRSAITVREKADRALLIDTSDDQTKSKAAFRDADMAYLIAVKGLGLGIHGHSYFVA